MKESLESARNIHQILIIASAAIFIFGLSIGPTENKYDLARKELKAFKEVVDSVGVYRTKIIKEKFYQEVPSEKLKKIKSSTRFNSLGSSQIWEYTIFSMLDTFEQEWSQIDSLPVQILKTSSIKILSDTTLVNPETMVLSEFPIYLKGQESTEGTSSIRLETSGMNIYEEKGSYLKKFLARKLCSSNAPETFMPYLKAVRLEISNSNYSDLQLMLENLSGEFNSKNKNDADVIGLKVTGELLYIIGPITTLTLLLYLFTLVSHLEEIFMYSNNDDLKYFPWIAMFRNKHSIWITRFTIYLLPSAVSCYLIYKTQIGNWNSIIYFMIFVPIYVFIAHSLVKKITLLRNSIV